MKTLCFVLLLSTTSFIHAQSWSYIPKDSSKCFLNPTQDKKYLQGIDYRKYTDRSDTIVYDLGLFSRNEIGTRGYTKNKVYQLPTKNSSFGRFVTETPSAVQFIFVNCSYYDIAPDTFTILKNLSIDTKWTVFENDDMLIEGQVRDKNQSGADSLIIMDLLVQPKRDTSLVKLPFEVSKSRGILSMPVFFDILTLNDSLQNLESVLFYPFEMDAKSYCEPQEGMEFHYFDERYEENFPQLIKLKCVEWDGETGKFLRSSAAQTSEGWVLRESDVHITTSKVPGCAAHYKFQVPGKWFDTASIMDYFPWDHKYTRLCNRLVRHHTIESGNRGYEFHQYDTAIYGPILNVNDYPFKDSFMVGIGAMSFSDYSSGPRRSYRGREWKYIKIPGECELGSDAWRLSSVPSIHNLGLTIHPNPAVTTFQLSRHIENVSCRNIQGQVVELKQLSEGVYDVSDLESGTYILMLEDGKQISTQKLVVVH